MIKCLIKAIVLLVIAFLFVIFNSSDLNAASVELRKAAPKLTSLLEKGEEIPEMIPVYVLLNEQYDDEKLYDQVKYLPKQERREITVRTLIEFARKSQQDLRRMLEDLEDRGDAGRLRYLWISNIIGLEASLETLYILDSHPDVMYIEYDPPQRMIEEGPEENDSRRPDERSTGETRNTTYNVENVNAPEVWELGYDGEGALVAVIDSGVNYNHNDIRNQMWEHPDYPNHGYNFWDDNLDPMDNQGHGTHCAGTVAGDGTSGVQTGIAPGATIMALKPLHGFTGQHQTFWHAVQFAVEYEADILSVSMYWRHTLLDDVTRATFRTIMVNTLSAGVIMFKSAGNDGNATHNYPIPYNVNIPAGSPPPWLNPDQPVRHGVSCVVSVGATDRNNHIAGWSSRGPVTWQGVPGWDDYPYQPGPGLLKPDIVAPGVSVESLIHSNNTGYTIKSGTSMAAPAVAGVAALMLSRNPYLTPERMNQIIEESADAYGEEKCNTYGAGLVDALAAVNASTMIGVTSVSLSGEENEFPEYGEIYDLDVRLVNIGEEDVAGITAVLSTDDQYFDILNDTAQYGAIDPDSTVTLEEAFTIEAAGAVPHLHQAKFMVTISSAEDDREWLSPIAFDIAAPVLDVDTVYVAADERPLNGSVVDLNIGLKNNGGSQAREITTTLTTNDQYVTILQGLSNYPDIDTGEREYNRQPFSVEIAENAPHKHKAKFMIDIEAQGGQEWQDSLSIELEAPSLTVKAPFVYDPLPGGNENGLLDPGEEAIIYMPLANTGGNATADIEINAVTESDLIEIREILDSRISLVNPGERVYPALSVVVSDQAEEGDVFDFSCLITTGEYSFESSFIIGVGGLVYAQIGDGQEVNGVNTANPINIYFTSLRSQTVYTAEEIRNAGITTGVQLSGLGYYIEDSPDHPLRNWLIRMRHTSSSSVRNHIEGPYHIAYSRAEYQPQEFVWDVLDFDDPFEWNGRDNILVDTAFAPVTAWSATGRTRIYDVENGFRYTRADEPDQTDLPTTEISNNKPQILLQVDTTPGVEFRRARKLSAEQVEAGTQLSWQSPTGNRNQPEQSARNRRTDNRADGKQSYRNLEGYNVYRNGIKINEELLQETEFVDHDEVTEIEKFYHVTAVYERGESIPSNVITVGQIAELALDPKPGVHHEPVNVRISTDTDRVTFHYTTDESEPDENSPVYTQPVEIDYLTELNVMAVRENWRPSFAGDFYHILYAPQELRAQEQSFDAHLSWNEPWSPDDDSVLMSGNTQVRSRLNDPKRQVVNNESNRSSLRSRNRTDTRSSQTTERSYLLGYNIYRSIDGGNYEQINEEIIPARSYIDNNLEKAEYRYYTTAVYQPGESGKSNIVRIQITGETDVQQEEAVPLVTQLNPAYPNPFNPETMLSFTLKNSGPAKLQVFDITGRRVKTVHDDYTEKGYHQFVWDGSSDEGRKAVSGIYFYRLITADYKEVRKVILLK